MTCFFFSVRWHRNWLHHRDLWRIQNRKNSVVSHNGCHMSGKLNGSQLQFVLPLFLMYCAWVKHTPMKPHPHSSKRLIVLQTQKVLEIHSAGGKHQFCFLFFLFSFLLFYCFFSLFISCLFFFLSFFFLCCCCWSWYTYKMKNVTVSTSNEAS